MSFPVPLLVHVALWLPLSFLLVSLSISIICKLHAHPLFVEGFISSATFMKPSPSPQGGTSELLFHILPLLQSLIVFTCTSVM